MVGRTKSVIGCVVISCFSSCLFLLSYYPAAFNHPAIVSFQQLVIRRKPIIKLQGKYRTSVLFSDISLDDDEEYPLSNVVTSDEIQQSRSQLLHSRCQKSLSDAGKKFTTVGTRNFVIDQNYRFLYCPVAKAAEANWKRVILVLENIANTTEELQHFQVLGKDGELYQTVNMTNNDQFLNYTRFIFVRHPFKRILSAYRNKFELPDEWGVKYQRNFGTKIIKQYRWNATQHSLETGDDVTFPEFIQYILDRTDAPERFNMHWRPQYLNCDVCNQHFDIIGKFESIQDDALYVLNRINASQRIHFPKLERSASHVTNSSRDDIYSSYFSYVSRENITNLYKLYELDFKLFGYEFPYDLLTTIDKSNASASEWQRSGKL
ncbi:carbohydrate sulfotransferase 11-like [Glandiceps talaboti]